MEWRLLRLVNAELRLLGAAVGNGEVNPVEGGDKVPLLVPRHLEFAGLNLAQDGPRRASLEARALLLAAAADGPAGNLPTSQTGITVSRLGVLVTALGQNPDGRGTLLRVWDQTGKTGKLVVTLPGKFKLARPVNLRG